MLSPGLTNTPTTKLLLIAILTSSIALSILDIKHLASIHVSPHLWPYAQFWRCLIWQVAGFANSTEALFAAMLVYHCRVVERAWGKRKFVSFLLSILPYTTLLPPILLSVLRPLSLYKLNYLPSGPSGVVFALLAQYYASIPHTFRYRIAMSTPKPPSPSQSPSGSGSDPTGNATTAPTTPPNYLSLLLSDKSTTYLVAAQLALSQFPSMLLPACVGWFVGLAWRGEMLPGLGRRVPAWVVGEREVRRGRRGNGGAGGEGYEDLRRRLEGEVVAASGSGAGSEQGQAQRRNVGGFMDRLRGAF